MIALRLSPRRVLPYAAVVALVLAAAPHQAAAQVRSTSVQPPPGLVILPPAREPREIELAGVSGPALGMAMNDTNGLDRQLQQLIAVRLANQFAFRIVSPIAMDAALLMQGLTHSSVAEPATLQAVAALTDAEYALVTGLSVFAGAGTWSLELRRTADSQVVWSRLVPVDLNRPDEALETASSALATFAREVRMVQEADIRALLEAGDAAGAARLLERFLQRRQADAGIGDLAERINVALVSERLDRARMLGELWLFDEALVEVNRAFAIDPASPEAQAVLEELRDMQRGASEATFAEQLRIAQELVAAGYHASAALLLDTMDVPSEPPVELAELEAAIRQAAVAERRYEEALAAYWRGDYPQARTAVRQAIATDPTRTDFAALLADIDRADTRQASGEALASGYRSRIAQWDVQRALLGPAAIGRRWLVVVGRGPVYDRDRTTLDRRETRQTVISGWLRQPYLLPVALSMDAVAVHGGWMVGAATRFGQTESDRPTGSADGSRILERSTRWHIGPAGGGFLTVGLLGFSVSVDLAVRSPALLVSDVERNPAENLDSRDVLLVWAPTLDLGLGVAFHITGNAEVHLRYEQALAGLTLPETAADRERYRTRTIGLGYAWRR